MDSITVRRLAAVRITMAGGTNEVGVLTQREAARLLGVSPRGLRLAIRNGTLPLQAVPWNKWKALYLRSDVERILSGQRRTARRPAA